jgi:hypothetical protein
MESLCSQKQGWAGKQNSCNKVVFKWVILRVMLGFTVTHLQELAPDDEALEAGVLTQFGGCLLILVRCRKICSPIFFFSAGRANTER